MMVLLNLWFIVEHFMMMHLGVHEPLNETAYGTGLVVRGQTFSYC